MSQHDTDAAALVALYDERIELTHAMAQHPNPTGEMADSVFAKGAELDDACEQFRRKHYPRKHHVIVGLRQVAACSKTRRSVTIVYKAAER